VDWSANALRRNAQPPSQSCWSSSTRFTGTQGVRPLGGCEAHVMRNAEPRSTKRLEENILLNVL
jgi:hypothetical protein